MSLPAPDDAGQDDLRTTADSWQHHPAFGATPRLDLTHGGEPCARLVVVAAHPDDETLGAGGLIATAAAADLAVYVVLLTAGEASRYVPSSTTRRELATVRLAETEDALARLAPDNYLAFLGASDGGVAEAEDAVARSLTDLLGDGSRTLLAAPWRHDGHPDHEAAGRAAARAAEASGARLLEYPLFAWTHQRPEDFPWADARCLPLAPTRQDQKSDAISAHVSQVPAGDDETADPEQAPLSPAVLEHFRTEYEHYLEVGAPST